MAAEKELLFNLTIEEFDTLNWALLNLEQLLNTKYDFKRVSALRNKIVDQALYNQEFDDNVKDKVTSELFLTTDEQKKLIRKAYFVFRDTYKDKFMDENDK